MYVYNYDPMTGAFTGPSSADTSPLEPGVFLIPAHATQVPPPPFGSGFIPRFANGSWSIVVDERGVEWFDQDGNSVIVDYLGDPAARGLLRVKPVPVYTPAQLRERMPPLTPRRMALAMYQIGLSEAQIDAALANDPLGLIEWKKASVYYRTHPMIDAIAAILGLPADQIDTLWMWASEL